jgi:hypothetical protein
MAFILCEMRAEIYSLAKLRWLPTTSFQNKVSQKNSYRRKVSDLYLLIVDMLRCMHWWTLCLIVVLFHQELCLDSARLQ